MGYAVLGAVALPLAAGCGVDEPDEQPTSMTTQDELAQFIEDNQQAFPEDAVVAVVDGEEVEWAATGDAELDSVFEIASLSKPLTGMLLADAVERGEVELQYQLGELLPQLEGTDAGAVTLEELATHTSGMPLVPTAQDFASESQSLRSQGENPYPITAEDLIDLAAEQQLYSPGGYMYSNMGISLLGHALAEQAGMTYEQMLQERLTEPVGMENTSTSHHQGHESDELLLPGYDAGGQAESFASEAFSPSSALRSSPEDFARLIQAIYDESAPGMSALEPSALDQRMGLGWALDGGYAWHNGISHGYASIVFIDPEAELAVVIFSNYGYQNTHLGQQLIDSLS